MDATALKVGRTSHLDLPLLCPQHPVVAPSTMLHWVVSCHLSPGELQGPTSPAVGSLKQLRDAGCTCISRGSHWMRTMTGEGLDLGSEPHLREIERLQWGDRQSLGGSQLGSVSNTG